MQAKVVDFEDIPRIEQEIRKLRREIRSRERQIERREAALERLLHCPCGDIVPTESCKRCQHLVCWTCRQTGTCGECRENQN
jgi:hypothetical protein